MENKHMLFVISLLFFFGIGTLPAQDYNWLISSTNAQEEDMTVYNEVYLDDTNYYVSRDYLFMDDQKHYMRYFMSTAALDYEFRDSLPDGCYVLIALTRKEVEKIPDNLQNRYVVATGCFENGMKQGKFTFSTVQSPPFKKGRLLEDKPAYKSIEFVNDTVNGNVQEYFDTALYHLAQYQMGVLNGYFILASSTATLLKYYQDGVLIKEFLIK
jgi:hypothetical protein